MQAVILAAGKATRLQHRACEETPKALVPVAGRPLVAHTLRNLPDEITEILFVIGEGLLGQQLLWTFGIEVLGRPVRYVIQKEPRGTGHAAQCAAPFVRDRFLHLMGDDIYGPEGLRSLVHHPAAALAYGDPHPERFGIFDLDAQEHITAVIEKPSEERIQKYLNDHPKMRGRREMIPVATGAYVLPREIMDIQIPLSERGEYELTTAVEILVKKKGITFEIARADLWLPVNTVGELAAAEAALR